MTIDKRCEAVRRRCARLTESQVLEIREAYGPVDGDMRRRATRKKETPTLAQLAKKYGVAHETIRAIVRRKLWADVA